MAMSSLAPRGGKCDISVSTRAHRESRKRYLVTDDTTSCSRDDISNSSCRPGSPISPAVGGSSSSWGPRPDTDSQGGSSARESETSSDSDSDIGSTGYKQRHLNTRYQHELKRQKRRTEVEYLGQMKTLTRAARALECTLRQQSGELAAESARPECDLEEVLAAAVGEVKTTLEEDRKIRDALRVELRVATAAYQSSLFGLTLKPAEARSASAGLEVANLQRQLTETRMQLQLEQGASQAMLERAAKQHDRERWSLVTQLKDQAAEIALLTAAAQLRGSVAPVASHPSSLAAHEHAGGTPLLRFCS